MKSDWTDPTDLTPSAARTARTIAGYRGFDPLRWCLRRHGDRSSITVEHIYAADMLRRYADAIAIGVSGRKNRLNLQYLDLMLTPKLGPTHAEVTQARAWRPFIRAMAMYTTDERSMITAVVLLNHSVIRWCEAIYQETGIQPSQHREMGRLVSCLDRLVEHFRSEIDQDIQLGRVAA
jgi:hypothetical protein